MAPHDDLRDAPLAWTRHDGPGSPPSGPPRVLVGALAISLLVAAVGLLSSDSLCPEHRTWVIALAMVVLAGGFGTAGALLLNRSFAAVFAIAPTIAGMLIGWIDATHDATRGQTIVAISAGGLVLATTLTGYSVAERRWRQGVVRAMAPSGDPLPESSTVDIDAARLPDHPDSSHPVDEALRAL